MNINVACVGLLLAKSKEVFSMGGGLLDEGVNIAPSLLDILSHRIIFWPFKKGRKIIEEWRELVFNHSAPFLSISNTEV